MVVLGHDSKTDEGRPRVLVVDDEPSICRALKRFLGAECDVVTETRAREALARIRNGERFDAILSDVMMPELTGMQLHAEIAAVDPAQANRMVFVTGTSFERSAREFLESVGEGRWIDKPFDRQELIAMVRSIIDRRSE